MYFKHKLYKVGMSYLSILLCYTILLQNIPYYVFQVLFLLVSIKIKKDDKIRGLFSFRNQSHDINEFYSKRKLFFRMYIIFYCICPQGSSLLEIKLLFGLKEISNESKIFNIILYFFVPPTNWIGSKVDTIPPRWYE